MSTVRDMFKAVRQGNADIAGAMLRLAPSLATETDVSGNTALHVAALADWKPKPSHVEIARDLLAAGADVDARGYEEQMEETTPLLLAVIARHTAMVQLLVEHGANPNIIGANAESPLGVAAAQGDEETCELLLKAGARPDLHAAARIGLTADIGRLVRENPDQLEAESPQDDLTPLECAAWHGRKQAGLLLIELGATANVFVAAGLGMLEWLDRFLAARPESVNSRPSPDRGRKSGAAPLTWAARNGEVQAVRLLLDRGADVKATDWSEADALTHAAARGAFEAIEPLVQAGADVNRLGRDLTPMRHALRGGHRTVAALLRAFGAHE